VDYFYRFIVIGFGLVVFVGGLRIIRSPARQAESLARWNRALGFTLPRSVRSAPPTRLEPVARVSGVLLCVGGLFIIAYAITHAP
jgi:hypothetical protein